MIGLLAKKSEARWKIAMCLPALSLVFIGLLVPLILMFVLSVHNQDGKLGIENYVRLFDPLYIRSVWITFKLAFIVTICCVILGYPLSYFLSKLSKKVAGFALLLVLLPFWTSLLVRTYAWLILLQRQGIVNDALQSLGVIEEPLRLVHNFFGTTVGMSHVLLPFLVLPLYSNMRSIPHDYERAAASLGASSFQTFRQIFFPLSIPGLVAGMTLVFILSLGFYVTPSLLGGGKVATWPVHVEIALSIYPDAGPASALGIGLLLLTLGIFGMFYAIRQKFSTQWQIQ